MATPQDATQSQDSTQSQLPAGYTVEPLSPAGVGIGEAPKPQSAAPVAQAHPALPSGYTVEPLTPSAATPSAPTAEQPSAVSKFVDDVKAGFGSAGAQSLASVAKLGSHIPATEWVSDKIGDILGLPKLPQGVNPYDVVANQMNKVAARDTQSTGGKVGAVAEGVAEFVLGEEALKGLSAGERLLKLGQVTKLLEKYPAMAQAAEQAMKLKSLQAVGRIARTSALSAGQAGLHNESMVQGAESGVVGGTIGEVAGAAGSYLQTLTPKARVAAARAQFLAEKAKAQDAFEALSQKGADAVENTALKVAKDAGATTTEDALNTTYTFDNAAYDLKATAKPTFEALDKESGGAFETIKNRIDNARKIIRNGAASLEDLEKAQDALKVANDQMDALFKQSSIDSAKLQAARTAWRKASTLEDLHDGLDRAYRTSSVVRPTQAKTLINAVTEEGGVNPADVGIQTKLSSFLDPKKFSARFRSTVDRIGRERLVDAIGDDGIQQLDDVDNLFRTSLASQKAQQELTQTVLAAAAKAPKGSPLNTLGYEMLSAGAGAGIGAGYGAVTSQEGQRTSGALQGATYGGLAGGAVGIPISLAHFMYEHPRFGVAVLRAVKASAAPLSTVTHVFQPSSGTVIPINQNQQ
jgi:hypothetical protein